MSKAARGRDSSGRKTSRSSKSNRARLHYELRKLSFESAWALVTAAGASPMCGHRWASVAHITARILSDRPEGGSPASPAAFGRMMRSVREEADWPTATEDFVPADARLDVRVRWGDEVYRIFPGLIERPVADIERARTLSRVLDERIVAKRGFGISDFVTVALRWMNQAAAAMSPTWPQGDRPGLRDEPRLTAEELNAAQGLLNLSESPTATLAEQRALDWATRSVEQVEYQPMHPQSTFGRTLAVWHPDDMAKGQSHEAVGSRRRLYLPPGFVPEVLSFGVSKLADSVTSPDSVRDYAAEAVAQTRRALWRFGSVTGVDDQDEAPIVSPHNTVQFVMEMGDRRALLVQVFAGLNLSDRKWPDEFMGKIVADKDINRVGSCDRVSIPMSAGVLTVDAEVELTALVVLAASGHIAAPQRPGQATLSLEDLQWISRTADSETDLYMFCRDLARLSDETGEGPRIMFSWEGINYWEWWRSNGKSFYSGGAAPLIFIEPHWGEEEWKQSAKLSDLESSLVRLGLPGGSDFDVIEQGGGPAAAYKWELTARDGAS